jgi:hypothetical protein
MGQVLSPPPLTFTMGRVALLLRICDVLGSTLGPEAGHAEVRERPTKYLPSL